jgi:hypothetical protein
VLEYLAPEIAEQAERRRLEAEEAKAEAAARLWFKPGPDGAIDGGFRLPGHLANRLRAFVDAYANPRRPGNNTDDYRGLPLDRRRGLAFGWLLEAVLASDLPRHGGTATSIMVMIKLEDLVSGVGTATTNTGDPMTAEQARRLACVAEIIPVVLGKKGEILDQGRASRFFTPAQRRAMEIRDKECTTRGCHVPAAFCHAHHFRDPWSRGGKTDLKDGKLLCPFHHGRAHNQKWDTHHHPDGSTTFTRPRRQ